MSRTRTEYSPDMCDVIVDTMRDGGTIAMALAAIDISKQTKANWCNPEHVNYKPDIAEAFEHGRLLSQAWMEKQGIDNLHQDTKPGAKKFNHVLWYMLMKNCHGYRDTVATTHEVNIGSEQVAELIKKYDRDY